jgi:hypothetical protein
VTWSLLAVEVGTLNTHGVCTISLQAAVHPFTGPHTDKQTNIPKEKYLKLEFVSADYRISSDIVFIRTYCAGSAIKVPVNIYQVRRLDNFYIGDAAFLTRRNFAVQMLL